MSRIDEIKERAGKTALNGQEWMDNYRGDVQYLLSRLEIAEKELETISDHPKKEILGDDLLPELEEIASQARKQLHE